VTNPGFARSLGGIVSGTRPYTGAPYGRSRYNRGYYTPAAYPVFVGGYYSDYSQQPPANVTIINQQPAPPQIIINNQAAPPAETAKPVIREYGPDSWKDSEGVRVYQAPSATSAAPEDAASRATIYLIAFRDGAIYPALAWWIEGDTLHYVTAQGKPNKATLSLIDREFSERLNRERGIEFRLPAL
jgi:hypothetical protein